jgi:inward rectifier potassium channel
MTEQKYNDLGLGTKSPSSQRGLNKDGSFNVKKKNVPFSERVNFYHVLVSMSWTKFFLFILSGFIVVNLLFAGAYMAIGVEHLTGIEGKSEFSKFMEAFFFSSQTLTTLGYGRVAPVGMEASTIAAIESTLGLLAFALATGLLYGRFSKPVAKIKYSQQAVMAPYRDMNGFMFRVVNPRDNQLIEIEVSLTLSMIREDSSMRSFHFLELERSKVNFLPSTWTIVHPITSSSPLYTISEPDMLKKDVEFIVLIKAFDETFSQTVYSRSSYKASEVKWAEKFVYVIEPDGSGTSVDVRRLDETEKAVLN